MEAYGAVRERFCTARGNFPDFIYQSFAATIGIQTDRNLAEKHGGGAGDSAVLINDSVIACGIYGFPDDTTFRVTARRPVHKLKRKFTGFRKTSGNLFGSPEAE